MDIPSELIWKKLVQGYHNFTRSEKKISDYIFNHKIGAQYMTITELAAECGVGEATLTRFCRTLGYNSFTEFKMALAKNSARVLDADETGRFFGNISPSDSLEDMCWKLYNANREALAQTYRLIDPKSIATAVDLMEQANHIYCYGQGGSSILAMEAWGRFIPVSSKFQWIQDSHMQAMAAALLDPGDVILYFSFSGATKDLMDVAQITSTKNVNLILITGYSTAPAASMADVVLLCSGVEGPLQMGSVAVKVAQLYIIDILYNEFSRRDMAKTAGNLETTANAIVNKHLQFQN